MTRKTHVTVTLDIGRFTLDGSNASEHAAAARMVSALLQSALAERDISANVDHAVAFSEDDARLIVEALRWFATAREIDVDHVRLVELAALFGGDR